MPTGYTEKLYDGEQAFEDFALRAARAFGALVEMRDMGMGATIPDEFVPSPYHADKLAETHAHRSEVRSLPAKECERRALAEYEGWDTGRKAEAEVTAARRARYEAMRARALAWTPPTDDHTGLRDFMVQQLDESIRFDCSDWEPPTPTRDGAEWREQQLAKAERDIAYHETELAAERQRAAERTEWVRALRDSLSETQAVR